MHLPENFEGKYWFLCDNWFDIIKVDDYKSKPIKYLEIGTFYGANFFTVASTYGSHPDSSLYCIDPWMDYDEYPEYKGETNGIYNTFLRNVEKSEYKSQLNIRRGFSHVEAQKFDDEFFDLIYIDGNHQPEYVLEDAVVSFRKLKKNGVMVFDDYCSNSPDLTMRGINAFLSGYYNRLVKIGQKGTQLFIKKL